MSQMVPEAGEKFLSPDSGGANYRPNSFVGNAASYDSSKRHSHVEISETSSTTGASTMPYQKHFRSRRSGRRENTGRRGKRKLKGERWLCWIPTIGFLMGLAFTGLFVYFGIRSETTNYRYCSVLDETFSTAVLNPRVWTYEIQVGGFGNENFEQTTDSKENVFIKDKRLHIKPTLQDERLITHNSTINLLHLGTCTSNLWADCVTTTNTTNGTIVQPVRSARLNTKLGALIRYGKVEVTAKIPKGDWLWPAIWMMPERDTYGPWPASGEIDIMESRGNNYSYPGGNNVVSSALHFGPDGDDDAYRQAYNYKNALHSEYGDDFHVYGMEWTEDYIYTYIDTQLLQVLYLPFNKPFWDRGYFPVANANGTQLIDPWSQTGRLSTPFDQKFYLIINLAVGGTNGWFIDGIGGKPWVDASPTAKKDFWDAKEQWYPTWKEEKSDLIVDRVQMWQQC